MNQLQIRKYAKFYGKIEVLKVEELTIENGIYWLKGKNGSGKSTFLKSVAGIIDFYGEIMLNHKISCKENTVAYRKKVNFAEAEPIFPAFLTGKELINLFADAKEANLSQIDYYLEALKMKSYIDENIGAYSSGMQKKLSLVLAFIGKPDLILLDEPLTTLDVESVETLHKLISERHISDNTSFIISSHHEIDFDNTIAHKTISIENNTITLQ